MQRLRAAARRGDADAMTELAAALLRSGAAGDAEMATRWYRRAAEGGSTVAVEWMCRAYRKGARGVSVDLAESYRWAVCGAEAGSTWCQQEVGYALEHSIGVAKDEAAAVRWYRVAADAGNATAQLSMHICHWKGLGGLRADDPADAVWLRKSAEGGHVHAQEELAWSLANNGVAGDALEAAGWYRRAAEGGDTDAIEWMAEACFDGAPGVAVDPAESYRWSVRGAEAGSPWCQVAAGYKLANGLGVSKDEQAAVHWYRRSGDAGNFQAQYNLYTCIRDGLGGLRADDPAGVAWLRKAAEGGYVDAQAELSGCLRTGDGMPADVAAANTWGLRAAEGGHSTALEEMGRRLLRGEGIATDAVAGVALLRRAVDAGALSACLHLGDAHAAGLGGLPVDEDAARALYERAAAGGGANLAASARSRLHELPSSLLLAGRTALPAEVPPVCGHAACGAALDAGTLSGLCAGCLGVRYCDSGCQRAAWAGHRPVCKAAAAARAAALAAAPPPPSASPLTAPSSALVAQREEIEVWARMPLDALLAAAESGTAAAQGAIGEAHLDGMLGVAEDAEAGLAWLRKAAAQGLLPARMYVGRAADAAAKLATADAGASLTEALCWYRPLAEAGDADAQLRAYASGKRRAAALNAEAGRWLRAAAAQLQPRALNELGVAAWYGHSGLGVARDRDEAFRLFAVADAAGLPQQERAKRPCWAPGSLRRE
jgi:hypothetical protein